MKNILLVFISTLFILSCNNKLEGEGAATAKQEFAVDQFESVEIDCNCDVTIIPSTTHKIIVESHQNLIDNLEINSKKEKLRIKEKHKVGKYDLYNVHIYSTVALNQIELNEHSKMKVSGTLKAENLKLKVNDKSTVNETFVDIRNFELSTSDLSNIAISGTAINLKLESSDKSIVNLSDLQTVEINFNAKNNAHVSVYALKDLSGKASDNAHVIYKGDPNKDTKETDRALINKE